MEKNNMEILGDFLSEIESLKKRISTLEESVVAMKAEMESAPVETPSEPVSEDVDIDIDIVDIPESEPEEPVAPVEVDLPLAEPELPVASEAAEPESEIEVKPLPVPESEPKKSLKTVDGSYAWQSAKPGMPVKNLRSAISLFDRALFINTLFKEDYSLYDKTISELNQVASFPEAIDYILTNFPDWNLASDVVYSFMMALRKKLG
ncbi:MAG: hypothetical protein II130_03810 [Bacteroidales bacterium]|jgi:hypothetical protein|nr:hypothetical protein [Bacteroidales bacterium]MBQ1842088.1 hypothetical protein [Bacteroidales bacterium]MBQ2549868.1 hypothetical protein [Bacteroidales bacterium]